MSLGKGVKGSDATRMRRNWRHLVVAVAVEEAPTTMTRMTILLHFLDLLHLPSLRPNKKSWICARVSSRGKRAMEAPQPERATKARWLVTAPTLCLCLCLLYALCLLTPPTNLGTTLQCLCLEYCCGGSMESGLPSRNTCLITKHVYHETCVSALNMCHVSYH